jgi:hypothetical protein
LSPSFARFPRKIPNRPPRQIGGLLHLCPPPARIAHREAVYRRLYFTEDAEGFWVELLRSAKHCAAE